MPLFKKLFLSLIMCGLFTSCGSSNQPPAEVTIEVEVPADVADSNEVQEIEPQQDIAPENEQENAVAQDIPQDDPVDENVPADEGDNPPNEEEQVPVVNLNDLVGIYGGGQIMIDDDIENVAQHQLALDFLNHSGKRQVTITINLNGVSIYLKGDWPENNAGFVVLYSRTYDMSCVINNVGQLVNDKIINMFCERNNSNNSYTGYQLVLSETNNGVFIANAESFYSNPTAVTYLSGGDQLFGVFAGQELVFEVYFEDTFMIADLYLDGAYDGRLAGQIDFNENFVINRVGDDGTLLSCKVDSANLFGQLDRNTAPVLNMISCETTKFEFAIDGMTPDFVFINL